ncbi:hypothetical protein ACLMJK_003275 [Lecanora helva]
MLTQSQLRDVFSIIADEIGVTRDEVYDSDDFSDLGLDDVLSKSIVGQINERLSLNLPSTLFRTNTSAIEIQNFFKGHDRDKAQETNDTDRPAPQGIEVNDKALTNGNARPTKPKVPLSVTLQGQPCAAAKTIFLLPDGSGSAMVYSQFPQMSDSTCIIALNSPFLVNHNGASISFDTSIEDLCLLWTEEIQHRQPHGPYILGGYSAGGYYAFEVAKQLRRKGEKVAKLVLIDSPGRVEFEAPQLDAIQFLSEHGLLGDWGAARKTPEWFVNHFKGTIGAVEKYMPTNMDEHEDNEMPECFAIWATKGLLDDVDITPAESGLNMNINITKFMLEEKGKTDFGLHGWDRILPKAMIWETTVQGNHFSLVHRPNCNAFQTILNDVLEDDPKKRKSYALPML